MRSIFITTLLATATVMTGCATAPAPAPSSNGIDYAQQRYETTRFEKAGTPVAQQQALFKTDIDSCEAIAQKQSQETAANSAKLAAIYGQALSPEVLAKMKRAQVVMCMTGDKQSADKGKGWTAR